MRTTGSTTRTRVIAKVASWRKRCGRRAMCRVPVPATQNPGRRPALSLRPPRTRGDRTTARDDWKGLSLAAPFAQVLAAGRADLAAAGGACRAAAEYAKVARADHPGGPDRMRPQARHGGG